ncbi:type II secretion system protein [Sphaerisporangium krabiense]|uniref:Flp pilus assembly protein TadB n=1 Tax=Sphaerisporangium krabiense TaxID=763782 RepID=A0A7W9DNZ1_9ACTN|nr:type II secretion system F family protein [Sphaerisporangium krabiense]MBB5624745.1 Flp pilus assembly protein TadB [Sphaerisporangium krabiense]GII61294.1 type II secretion system protein [Sphaerisporangium krabiense]
MIPMPTGLLDWLALLAGAATGGGLFLFGLALYGVRRKPATPDRGARRRELLRRLSTRSAVATITGGLVLVVSGWPVMAAGAVLLVLAWRGLTGGASEERAAMVRLEGLAAWTESLRDTIAGAAGLEQAIPSSIRAAAPTLRPHLRSLVDRLHTRMPLPDALRLFADELDDPSADLVVAALILNAKLRGPGLREVLGALAVSAREELDMRRRVEAERRSTRRSVQIVVGTALAFAALLVVFNRSYVAEYDSLLGQAVLVVVAALFGAGFAWMRRLARFDKPARLLGAVASAPVEREPVAGGVHA